MTRPPLHVCIATGQNLANLIPVIQFRANEARILATPSMRESARLLKRVFGMRAIRCEIVDFPDSPPDKLEEAAQRLAVSLEGQSVLFNATGGTKLMVLALTEALRLLDSGVGGSSLEIVYSDTAHDHLVWLSPRGRSPEPMQNLLTLSDIVATQGFVLGKVKSKQEDWVARVEQRGELTLELGDKADRLAGLFGALNRLAHRALDPQGENLTAPTQVLDYAPAGGGANVLKQAVRLELIEWDDDTKITFANAESARYFGGVWLEEYALFKVRRCGAADWAVGVDVQALDSQAINELDAVVVDRNRLLVIECKTPHFGRDAQREADIIYKLDHLGQKAGGLMHDSVLLSARPLTDAVRERAKSSRITVIEAQHIRELPQWLHDWRKGA